MRFLERASLVELVEKFTIDLGDTHRLILGRRQYFKGYMVANEPKQKYAVSLKDWIDTKKLKNAIIRWLSRRYQTNFWNGEDIDVEN